MSTTVLLDTAKVPHVNLMPPEAVARRRGRRLRSGAAAGVAAAVAVVGGLYVVAVTDVEQARYELEQVQATHVRLDRQARALGHVPKIYEQVSATEALLEQARAEEVRWSYYLNDLGLAIPDGVWLTTMTATTQDTAAADTAATPAPTATPGTAGGTAATPGIGTVTFAGTAFSHEHVATWLEMLAAQRGYADAYLNSSTERMEGSRQVVDFTTDVVVTDEALWTNYLETTGQQR